MKAKEFKQKTGYTMLDWARKTNRSYYKVTDEIYRGSCSLVIQGAGRDHPLWDTWSSMKTRCYNKNSRSYSRYGGRGIRVCSEWFYSFDKFVDDMYASWASHLTLDRIKNDGPYSRENCRWATSTVQALNRSTAQGCPGVHYCVTTRRWIFRLRKESKLIFTRVFKDEYLAVQCALNSYIQEDMIDYQVKAKEYLDVIKLG
jgi:hypothetical protein